MSDESTREAEMVRPSWMGTTLVVLVVAAVLLLVMDSPLVAVFAIVLFLSCPVAMVIVGASMRRHGSGGRDAQTGH